MTKKYEGKRFILSGSYPFSGGWNDYVFEFDTELEAKLAAVHQLDQGCDAHLWDQETGISVELVFRYDGLGHA